MGICSRRRLLLTICILQLITTIERQVFDFLGSMWVPILVNFFNIIFVILGFFGVLQYRPKYIISYCVWNILWLGWNIFLICFHLSIGALNKDSDVLNLGTGSFSWWQVNGIGCKAVYNDITEQELVRPARPVNVTGCLLDYEVIEVLHAGTQCVLAFAATVGGICLIRVFLEEDDSFDFVGGGDFGLAGHTPLHPMYVSYSALPPLNSTAKNLTTTLNQSSSTTTSHRSLTRDNNNHQKYSDPSFDSPTTRLQTHYSGGTTRSSNNSIRGNAKPGMDYADDYSNPLDHLHRRVRSPCNAYDSLDITTPTKYQRNKTYYPHSSKYSPIVSAKLRPARSTSSKQHRNSYKPRIFTDHIREQPLRSFYSDPRLAVERKEICAENKDSRGKSTKEHRPLSLHGNNF